jgi:hypothetical protein
LQTEGSPLQQDAGTYLDTDVADNEHERGKASYAEALSAGPKPQQQSRPWSLEYGST